MNEEINDGEVRSFQKYFHFSHSLDPNIENILLAENKYITKIYFKERKGLCFSFESEVIKEKRIFIYRNIKIEGEDDTLIKRFYLLELFFTVPMRFDIRTIKIQNFPIYNTDMKRYLDEFNRSYQKRLVPQKELFSKDNSYLQSGVYQITIAGKNHYIPQGYLKAFECKEKAGFIYNFKLNESKFEETSGDKPVKIENILYSSHFYSLGMELILKNIEDAFYSIRDKIVLEKNIRSISYEEKVSIVRYIFAQYTRTPLERNRLINSAKNILKSIYINLADQKIKKDDIKIEFEELYIRKIYEEGIFQFLYPSPKEVIISKLFEFYLNNKWNLIPAEHMKFFTSDNPIILYNDSHMPIVDLDYIESLKTPNSKIYGTKRPHGLTEPGIQLYFPITPEFCILIYNPQNGRRLLQPVQINEQILIQCYQNLLSPSNNIKSFLKRKLNQNREKRDKFVKLHQKVKMEEY